MSDQHTDWDESNQRRWAEREQDDAPDFCARCGEIEADCDCYGTDDDAWGGMTRMERADYAELAIHNGNLMDAITFVMHDGDVRADSVRMMLDLVGRHILNHPATPNRTLEYIDKLNRLIDTWERE